MGGRGGKSGLSQESGFLFRTGGRLITVTVPVRGGTDGARLSYEGLPCPNLCTGGENYHGRFEYIPVEDMELCTQMLVELLRL